MNRILMAVALMAMSGGAYATDLSDLQTFKASDVKSASDKIFVLGNAAPAQVKVERDFLPCGNGQTPYTQNNIIEEKEFLFESGAFSDRAQADIAMQSARTELEEAGYLIVSSYDGHFSYTVTFKAPVTAEIRELTEVFSSSTGLDEKAEKRAQYLRKRGAIVLEKNVRGSGYTIKYLIDPFVPCMK